MKRQLGIVIIAILMCVVGVVNLISTWILFYLLLPFLTSLEIGLIVLILGFGASLIVAAVGLWIGKRWAWLLGLISCGLQLISSTYTIITFGSSISLIGTVWHMLAISFCILAIGYLSSTFPKKKVK